MEFYDEFNSVFFLTLATLVCGSVTLAIKYCFKSKCDDVNLCGIRIHRNVEVEENEIQA